MPPVKLKLGIIGYPLEHTLSPIMHTAALQHLNINGEYKAYEIKEEELEKRISEFKKQNFKGLNVTIPYKKKIIPFLDEMSDNAKLSGAVNTITFLEGGKLRGNNTDVTGFWESIPEQIRKNLTGKKITVLGCGGSSDAVVTAILNNASPGEIVICGRDKNKLSLKKPHQNVSISLIRDVDLSTADVLINTTPVGMSPNINNSPVSIDQLKKMPEGSLVYDIIYNPSETKLLKDAKSLGLNALNGVEMLVRQGAASLNIWLDKNVAPVQIMRDAVMDSLELSGKK